MRILFLYDFPLWGSGSATYLRHLIQELIKLGHKIGVISPEERRFLPEKIKQYTVKLPQVPVFVGHPELKGAKRYSELSEREITEIYKSYLDATLEAINNFNPNILHVNHLSIISWVAWYISSLKNIKYIISTHGTCVTNLLANKRFLPLSQDAARHAKAITTVSSNARSEFLKNFGREYNKKIYIIPGGVDMKYFSKQMDVSYLDKKYKLKNKKVVFFSGRLSSEKGIKYLINAAENIKGEVLIAGEGPEKKYIETVIARKKLKNVHLLGYIAPEKLIDFYYRANVLVAPSVAEEAFGLSILEAMASKTPVITTRKGGIPSLVKNDYNGFFVKPKNSSQIAIACNKILENNELMKKMGENARETVEKKFTWEKTALKFQRIYKKIYPNEKNNRNEKK